MNIKKLLLSALALCACVTLADGAKQYRVATLPTWKNWAHNVQWNYLYEEVGWSYTNLQETVEDMDWLKNHLGEIDMLVGTQLFGYNGKPKDNRVMPYDMKNYAKPIADWVRKGGCIYMMDCNYPGAAFDWFKEIDPALEVSAAPDDAKCNGYGPAIGTEPIDPLLFFPMAAEYGFSWNHMTVPDQNKTAWKILARCQHGDPTLMVCRLGKGMILLNSCTSYNREFLHNLKANCTFINLGLAIKSSYSPLPLPGPNKYEIFCANTSDHTKKGKLTLRLAPILERDAKGNITKVGKDVEYSEESEIAAGAEGSFTLTCAVKERGSYRAELVLNVDGIDGTCFNKGVDLQDFFTLNGTRYRNLLTTTRRFDDISFKTSLWPDDDGTRDDFKVKIIVVDAKGFKVAESPVSKLARGESETSIKLPRNLGEGVYKATAELFEGEAKDAIAKSETELEVIGDVPGAAFYDEDAVMLVDGEPFLPLGIYHLGANTNNAWAEAADIGFNVFNIFSHRGMGSLGALRELDVKTLWEQLPHRAESACRTQGTELMGNPAALLWYTVDEPSEAKFPFVKSLNDAWHATDKYHPTFIVSYQPQHFPQNAKLSDILAPDNYPYSKEKGDDSNVWSISKTADRAVDATKGTGPVIFVPQAFGHETPEVWRNMSFQALCHGAKGLIWYAWRENNTVGMKYNPELRKEATITIAELRAIAPALLNGTDKPRYFVAADGNLHGLVMTDPATGARYLMLANSDKNPVKCDLELPELDAALAEIDGGRYGKLSCADGKVKVDLPKFGSGIYAIKGALPKIATLNREWVDRELPARASGKTLTVSADGKDGAFTTIQAALDAAKDGDVINVGPGTYGPVVCDNKLVDVIATGSITNTFIDAGKESRALTLTLRPFGDMSKERNVLFKGFAIKNGKPGANDVRPMLGGAVLGGTLVNCSVSDSTARYGGGAAFSTLQGCYFNGNNAKDGGAVAMCDAKECSFENNSADYDGGAMHFGAAYRCYMNGNRAGRDGGATHYGSVTSCNLIGNRAGRDGGAMNRSYAVSTFAQRNSAGNDGGAVFAGQTHHCTLVDNSAANHGGAVAAYPNTGWGAMKQLNRSVLCRNTSKNYPDELSVTNVDVTVVWIDQATDVKGFFTNDMQLVSNNDFLPAAGSPLIDASDFYFERGMFDAAGHKRVCGHGADIGAFERWSGETLLSSADFSLGYSPARFSDVNNFSTSYSYRDVFDHVKDGAYVFDGHNERGPVFYTLRPGVHMGDIPRYASLTKRTVEFEFSCEKGEGGEIMNFGSGPLSVQVDRETGAFRTELLYGPQNRAVNGLFWDGPVVADGKRHIVKLVYDKLNGMHEDVWRIWVDGNEVAVRNELKNERRYITYYNNLIFGGNNAANPFVGKLYKYEYWGSL